MGAGKSGPGRLGQLAEHLPHEGDDREAVGQVDEAQGDLRPVEGGAGAGGGSLQRHNGLAVAEEMEP